MLASFERLSPKRTRCSKRLCKLNEASKDNERVALESQGERAKDVKHFGDDSNDGFGR